MEEMEAVLQQLAFLHATSFHLITSHQASGKNGFYGEHKVTCVLRLIISTTRGLTRSQHNSRMRQISEIVLFRLGP